MKNTKKLLSLFLIIVTILSSTIVFCVNAAELLDETNIHVIETEDVFIEHELVPMMANSCGQWINGIYYNNLFLGEPNSTFLDESGTYNKLYYYDSNGCVEKVVHFSNHHGHPNPHYHTFSASYNERLGGLCWTENSTYESWLQ